MVITATQETTYTGWATKPGFTGGSSHFKAGQVTVETHAEHITWSGDGLKYLIFKNSQT